MWDKAMGREIKEGGRGKGPQKLRPHNLLSALRHAQHLASIMLILFFGIRKKNEMYTMTWKIFLVVALCNILRLLHSKVGALQLRAEFYMHIRDAQTTASRFCSISSPCQKESIRFFALNFHKRAICPVLFCVYRRKLFPVFPRVFCPPAFVQ